MGSTGGAELSTDATTKHRLYKLLQVDENASTADIKKAYRKLAVLYHPDKGGDPERFKDITHAYGVLSDDVKRRMYDEHGEEGLNGSTAGPVNIFDLLFSTRTCGNPGQRRRKTKDIIHPLTTSLEQLYTGWTKRIAVSRDVIDREGPPRRCEHCGGMGAHTDAARGGAVVQCPVCAGSGRRCAVKRVRDVLEVHIDKGAPHGHRIVFAGMADEHPGFDPGDLICIVHQQEHPEFQRRGADLFLAREICLLEALTGFRMLITHLDGRRFFVQTAPREVVQPLAEGTGLKAVVGEGMPTHRHPFVFGVLFVVLTIRFPDAVDPGIVPKLRAALPGPDREAALGEEAGAELCALEDLAPQTARRILSAQTGEAGGGDVHASGRPAGCPLQ